MRALLFRFCEEAAVDEQRSRLQLGIVAVRQEVGGTNVFRKRGPDIPQCLVRLRELETRLAEQGVLMQRVAVLNRGFSVLHLA